jgi:predicted transcriptional regulator
MEVIIIMTSCTRFKNRIDVLGLRKDHIAKLLGVSKSYLSQFLNEQTEFNDTLLFNLNYIISTYEDSVKELRFNKIA